jgi:hypothetical protein
MTDDKIAQLFGSWAVVKTAAGYDVQKLPHSHLTGPDVLAVHPNEASARKGLQRLELAAPMVIEKFEESIAHEIAIRNKLIAWFNGLAMPEAETEADAKPPSE